MALGIISGLIILCTQLVAFDSYEHIATGVNGVKLGFPGSNQQVWNDFPYSKFWEIIRDSRFKSKVGDVDYYPQYIQLKSDKEELLLGYGEIIALAGDFVGSTEKTISNGIQLKDFVAQRETLEKNFMTAFNGILPYPGNPFYKNDNLAYLRGLFFHEYESLIAAMGKKKGVHFNLASSHSLTTIVKDQVAYAKSPGYATLLDMNVDHFGDAARISYATGHALAMAKAQEAYTLQNNGNIEAAREALNLAYALDAFGSHFLTDLFSAGHVRTPRAELLSISSKLGFTSLTAGLMANAMHDEDNYLGLWLKDNRIGPGLQDHAWQAFGDGSYFDVKSGDNRQAIRKALQDSVDEVYKAFQSGDVTQYPKYKALARVGYPLPAGADFINDLVNGFPLFEAGDGSWPKVRKDYFDIGTGEYQAVSVATGFSSWAKKDVTTFNHANFFSFLLQEDVVDDLRKEVIVQCYNNYERGSWFSSRDKYVTLGGDTEVIEIDNSKLNFYKSILKGNLYPWGTFFVVSEDVGQQLITDCEWTMKTQFKLGKVASSTVTEIRAQIGKGYNNPLVFFNKEGELVRLRGEKKTTDAS